MCVKKYVDLPSMHKHLKKNKNLYISVHGVKRNEFDLRGKEKDFYEIMKV
jgi:hypothetical protein